MDMRASASEFEQYVASHLEPLAAAKGASVARKQDSHMQTAEFHADVLRVCLENEGGLLSLSVSPIHTERYWSVDAVATLMPRIRQLSEGTQRLTLDEQFRLVRENWSELQLRFRVPDYKLTAQLLLQGGQPGPRGGKK